MISGCEIAMSKARPPSTSRLTTGPETKVISSLCPLSFSKAGFTAVTTGPRPPARMILMSALCATVCGSVTEQTARAAVQAISLMAFSLDLSLFIRHMTNFILVKPKSLADCNQLLWRLGKTVLNTCPFVVPGEPCQLYGHRDEKASTRSEKGRRCWRRALI